MSSPTGLQPDRPAAPRVPARISAGAAFRRLRFASAALPAACLVLAGLGLWEWVVGHQTRSMADILGPTSWA